MFHFAFGCQHDDGNAGAVVAAQGSAFRRQRSFFIIAYDFDGILQRIVGYTFGGCADHVHMALQYDRGQRFISGCGWHLEHNVVLFVLLYPETLLVPPACQKIADQPFVVGRSRHHCQQFHVFNHFIDDFLIPAARAGCRADTGNVSGKQQKRCDQNPQTFFHVSPPTLSIDT